MKYLKKKLLLFLFVILAFALGGCTSETDPTGVSGISSVSGYSVGITAIHPGSFLAADGTSQAIIRVEVWNTSGQFVDGVSVTLAATLGDLESSSLTTSNGVAATTFTSSVPGKATITAMVENVLASAEITVF